MTNRTPRRNITLDDARWAWLLERGRQLGPTVALGPTQVIRWLIDRDKEAEARKASKGGKR